MKLSWPRLKIFKHWWGLPLMLFAFVAGAQIFFVMVQPAVADLELMGYVYGALSWVFEAIANFEAKVLLWLVNFLIIVSGYNNFINARAVQTGWPLVRDVANMFYILIMLVIAFATMLKIEKYSMKALLPRLIIMAILVNFSKTIIGVLIDFGQVIMLTFVNGYAATAGGNFVTMFGLNEVYKILPIGVAGDSSRQATTLSFLMAMILLGIALVVVLVFVAVLLFRIITLWILIILSPAAFMLGTFPKGQEYYSKWWKELVNNILVGPIVAFFLWLSLAVMGSGGTTGMADLTGNNNAISGDILGGSAVESAQTACQTEICGWERLGSFAVAIAMLLMGLQQVQELGVAGAGLASGAMGKMKSLATTAIKKAVIPAAAVLATGGVGGGILALGGLKGTMDVMARMPVIGKSVEKLRKGAEAYGLGKSGKIVNLAHKKIGLPAARGVGKAAGAVVGATGATVTGAVAGVGELAGRGVGKLLQKVGRPGGRLATAGAGLEAAATGITEKAAVATYGKVGGVVGGVVEGGTKRMAAGIAAEERGEARKGAVNVRELSGDDAIKEAFRETTPLSDVDKQWVFANQSRVLKDSKLRSQARKQDPAAFEKMVSGYTSLSEKTGNTDEANSIMKEFYKENPHMRQDRPAKGNPGDPSYQPAKTAAELIHEDVIGADPKKISAEALADDRVVGELSTQDRENILASGNADQRRAMGLSALQGATGLDRSSLGSMTSADPAVTAAIESNMSALPKGVFGQLRNIFDTFDPKLQASLIASGKMPVADLKASDLAGTAATSLADDKGANIADSLARSANEETIKEIQLKMGDDLAAALDRLAIKSPVAGQTVDARSLSLLASLQKDSNALLRFFQTGGRGAGRMADMAKSSNAPSWIKKLKAGDIINSTTNTATPAAKDLYQNISVNVLSKVIADAKRPEASPDNKETVAALAALVEKAFRTASKRATRPTREETKQLKKLLEAVSTIEAIDWPSKSSAHL